MSESCITKKVLAYSVKMLMRQRPLTKVTVGDICEACDMNRKSFYYHFRDKYDLINWIFQTDFQSETKRKESQTQDRLLELCSFLAANRDFYRAALQQHGQNSFYEYLTTVIRPMLAARLNKQGVLMEENDPVGTMVVSFYRDSIVRWVEDGCQVTPEMFLSQLYGGAELLERTVPHGLLKNGECELRSLHSRKVANN